MNAKERPVGRYYAAVLAFAAALVLPLLLIVVLQVASPLEALRVSRATGTVFLPTKADVGPERGRATVWLESGTTSAKVDKDTGMVVAFSSSSPALQQLTEATGPPRYTLPDAKVTALRFLQKAGVTIPGVWTLADARYADHGAGGQEYVFTWSRVMAGVTLPSLIAVSVDANTNKVFDYRLFDDTVTVPLRWRLSAGGAVARVVQARRLSAVTVEEAQLAVWYAGCYLGRQALLWRLTLVVPVGSGGQRRATADVDATTGEFAHFGETGVVVREAFAKLSFTPTMPSREAVAKLPPLQTVFDMAEQRSTLSWKAMP